MSLSDILNFITKNGIKGFLILIIISSLYGFYKLVQELFNKKVDFKNTFKLQLSQNYITNSFERQSGSLDKLYDCLVNPIQENDKRFEEAKSDILKYGSNSSIKILGILSEYMIYNIDGSNNNRIFACIGCLISSLKYDLSGEQVDPKNVCSMFTNYFDINEYNKKIIKLLSKKKNKQKFLIEKSQIERERIYDDNERHHLINIYILQIQDRVKGKKAL